MSACRRLFTLLIIVVLTTLTCYANDTIRIAVFEWKESDEVYSRAVEGFSRAFVNAGYRLGRSLVMDYYLAHNDALTAKTQVQRIQDGKYDLVLGLGTKSTQVLQEHGITTTPLLFTGVFDPVDAKLVPSLHGSKTNVAGSSHRQPFMSQFAIFKELVPRVGRLGVIFKDGEANSLVQLQEIQACQDRLGLTEIIAVPVRPTDDIVQLTEQLAPRVDAIYLPSDIYITSEKIAGMIAKTATAYKVPTFSALLEPTKSGVMLSVHSDLLFLGEQVGSMALKIINGAHPGTIPVDFQQVPNIVINDATARALGITIPDSLRKKVTGVIGTNSIFFIGE